VQRPPHPTWGKTQDDCTWGQQPYGRGPFEQVRQRTFRTMEVHFVSARSARSKCSPELLRPRLAPTHVLVSGSVVTDKGLLCCHGGGMPSGPAPHSRPWAGRRCYNAHEASPIETSPVLRSCLTQRVVAFARHHSRSCLIPHLVDAARPHPLSPHHERH
jgi:hypothetical protein